MRVLLIIQFLMCLTIANAQNIPTQQEALEHLDGNNFFELQTALNDYYSEYPEAAGQKQWRRTEWFLEQRLYPDGKMGNHAMHTMRAYDKYMSAQPAQRASHGQWTFMGPFTTSGSSGQGRVNSVKIHPTNDNIIYVGAANGGIWKSFNGGSTWINISPEIPMLAIADLGLDPNNANIIYALTGDGDPVVSQSSNHKQTEVTSIGIIKSTNGGVSWFPTNYSFEHPSTLIPYKLMIHPTNADTQYIASQSGIIKTTDNWVSSSSVLPNATYDIEFHPGNPRTMHCSGSNWIRKSIDGGENWPLVSDPDFVKMAQASRVELAVGPDIDSVAVYAMAGNWQNGSLAFYKSMLAGIDNSWLLKDTTTNLITYAADYMIGMAVSDTDHRDVFAGGFEVYRSLNSSGTPGSWTNINNGVVHHDTHDMLYRDGAIYVASDGGLYKSTDNGDNWTDLSPGLAITEIYRIAGTPQDAGVYYCGNQDNGTHKRDGTTTFSRVFGGDGTTCQINYTNANIVYLSREYGGMSVSFDAGTSSTSMEVPGGLSEWITPMEIDPVDPTVVFAGRAHVYRSDSSGLAGTWQDLGMPYTGDLNCLEQGTNNRNRVYVSQSSKMFSTSNALTTSGTATWTEITTGLPSKFITGIAMDPDDADEVYVCVSGFLGGNKVFKSTSGGNFGSWSNISGSLPNVPINCIVFENTGSDNNALYIGTDIGVFYRNDDLGDWIYFSTSLPAVNVSDLYINTSSNQIVAGTYGRGLWSSNLFDGCDVSINLGAGSSANGNNYYSATDSIVSTQTYTALTWTLTHYKAGNYIDLKNGFKASGPGFFEAQIGDCPDIASNPLSALLNPTGKFIMSNKTLDIHPGEN